MKKVFFMAMSLLLSALLFSACGADSPAPGTTVANTTESGTVATDTKKDDTGTTAPMTTAESEPPEEKTPLLIESSAKLIETLYPTKDVVIADFVATDAAFGADPTGQADSTAAINASLQACRDLGGGTVWLPAGKYLVSGEIYIPAFVTLRGDWQDPDTGNDYGTILLATPAPSETLTPGLINIAGSAGAYGLTIYYPEQSPDAVKAYPFTFYINGSGDGYMTQSILNCTILNGYMGIGATINKGEVHEMLTVDNVKMTCLAAGAYAMDQADVGTWKDVTVSAKYWAQIGADLPEVNTTKLSAYMRQNTTGLILGDLEWTEFSGLKVDGCKVGIHVIKGKRIEFAGSIYDLHVQNCDIGLLVDHIDERWGMLIARGEIEGSEHAIVNNTKGTIKLADVQTRGEIEGIGITADDTSLADLEIDYHIAPKMSAARLFIVNADRGGNFDISSELSEALKKAEASGGGVVYLPAGKYKLSSPISIPAGVELRGASSVAQREQSRNSSGTLILAYFGQSENPDTDRALITLEGEDAGVRGVRFIYPENNFLNGALFGVDKYSYTIRGTASGVYVINCSIAAGYNGVDFRGCDNHIIEKLIGCVYNNMMNLGGKNGIAIGCLQNGTAIYRNGCDIPGWPNNESNIWEELFDPITRPYTEYIKIENAQGQIVMNTFAYGVKTLIVNLEGENVNIINVGADNIGSRTPLLKTTGGSLRGVNLMRYNGKSYENKNTELALYNRISINEKDENTVILSSK